MCVVKGGGCNRNVDGIITHLRPPISLYVIVIDVDVCAIVVVTVDVWNRFHPFMASLHAFDRRHSHTAPLSKPRSVL